MNLFDSPSAPDTNPGQIANAQASERVGMEQVALAREQMEWSKANDRENREFSRPILESQARQAERDIEFTNDQRGYYRDVFQPVERQTVSDAMGYDSDENMERVANEARSDVATASARAREGLTKEMSRYGVDPSSSRFMTAMGDSFANTGMGEASAMNAARRGRNDAGIALRSGVANFGRNMPNTAAQSNQLSQGNNAAAMGGQIALGDAAIRGANSSLGFSAQGLQGIGQSANIYNQDFNNRFQNYNAEVSQKNAQWQAVGTAAGMWAGGRGTSDYNAKEDRQSAEGSLMLEGLETIPIESWKYKDGAVPGDQGQRHVGPMAQDVNMVLGEAAAPGGTSIDMITMNGMMMMGLKELAREVKALKSGTPLKGKRVTEPMQEVA